MLPFHHFCEEFFTFLLLTFLWSKDLERVCVRRSDAGKAVVVVVAAAVVQTLSPVLFFWATFPASSMQDSYITANQGSALVCPVSRHKVPSFHTQNWIDPTGQKQKKKKEICKVKELSLTRDKEGWERAHAGSCTRDGGAKRVQMLSVHKPVCWLVCASICAAVCLARGETLWQVNPF